LQLEFRMGSVCMSGSDESLQLRDSCRGRGAICAVL
jgi:hypothetical protein